MNQEYQLRTMRRLVQDMGWGQFMRDVGSLMAEQVFRTGGEQGQNLEECSRTIHCLGEFFEKCGKFTYPAELLVGVGSFVRLDIPFYKGVIGQVVSSDGPDKVQVEIADAVLEVNSLGYEVIA